MGWRDARCQSARVRWYTTFVPSNSRRASVTLHSALLVAVVAVAAALTITRKLKARRQYAKLKLSGGRKAFALNLFGR